MEKVGVVVLSVGVVVFAVGVVVTTPKVYKVPPLCTLGNFQNRIA